MAEGAYSRWLAGLDAPAAEPDAPKPRYAPAPTTPEGADARLAEVNAATAELDAWVDSKRQKKGLAQVDRSGRAGSGGKASTESAPGVVSTPESLDDALGGRRSAAPAAAPAAKKQGAYAKWLATVEDEQPAPAPEPKKPGLMDRFGAFLKEGRSQPDMTLSGITPEQASGLSGEPAAQPPPAAATGLDAAVPRGTSVLDRAGPQAQSLADPMLRPGFVDQFRQQVLSGVRPEDRMDVLRTISQRSTGNNKRAADQLLRQAQAENGRITLEDEGAARRIGPLGPEPEIGGGGKRARVEIPDVTPGIRDTMEGAAAPDIANRRMLAGGLRRAADSPDAISERGERAQSLNPRTAGEFAADEWVALKQGWVTTKQVLANSIDPGSSWAKGLNADMKGLDKEFTPQAQRQAMEVATRLAQAPGEVEKFGVMLAELLTEPTVLMREIARQAPLMAAVIGATVAGGIAGGGVARGAAALAPRSLGVAEAIAPGIVVNAGRAAGATVTGAAARAAGAGGDAAGQVFEHLTDKKKVPDELLLGNADVVELLKEGKTLDQAREIVAKSKARIAQGLGSMAGIVFGGMGLDALIAKRLGGDVAKRSAIKAMGKEAGGEVLEESLTQVAGNVGIRQVDPTRSLTEGTGEAAALALATSIPMSAGAAAVARTDVLKALFTPSGADRMAPTELRAKSISRFDELAAAFGLNPAAAAKVKQQAGAMPADEVPGFLGRITGALQRRGLVTRPIDEQGIAGLSAALDGKPPEPSGKSGGDSSGVLWRGPNADIPVKLADGPVMDGPDGRKYQPVIGPDGKPSFVPADELVRKTGSKEDAAKDEAVSNIEATLKAAGALPDEAINAPGLVDEQNDTGLDETLPRKIAGEPINREWTQFAPESGTLGIPRAQMPQIAAEHRGALVQFLNARGVAHEMAEVDPAELKPTQAEFQPKKVAGIAESPSTRSLLVSSDGHILDGHHQFLAALETGRPVRVVRLDAPIQDLLRLAHQFPSSTTAKGPSKIAGEPNLSVLSDSTLQLAGEVGAAGEMTRGMGIPDADWKALKAAGLVQQGTQEDGTAYEYVPAASLGAERDRRFEAARASRKAVSADEKAAGRERRAQNYERVAAEKEQAGFPDDAAELRRRAAEIRAGAPNEQSVVPDPAPSAPRTGPDGPGAAGVSGGTVRPVADDAQRGNAADPAAAAASGRPGDDAGRGRGDDAALSGEPINHRKVRAALERTKFEQKKRENLLGDPAALAAYATERGISESEMRTLLSDNYANNKAILKELEATVVSPEFQAAEDAAKKRASSVVFKELPVGRDADEASNAAAPVTTQAPAQAGATEAAAPKTVERVIPARYQLGPEAAEDLAVLLGSKLARKGSISWADIPVEMANKIGSGEARELNIAMRDDPQGVIDALNAAAPVTTQAPAQAGATEAAAPRVIGKYGRTPGDATQIELRPNADGTMTVYAGKYPMVDYESAQPIVVPGDTTDAQAVKAIKDAKAVTNKDKFYGIKEDAAPAAEAKTPAAPAPQATPEELLSAAEKRVDGLKALLACLTS